MNSLYLKDNLALIDYTSKYFNSVDELLCSEEFESFLTAFLKDLKNKKRELYTWVTKDLSDEACVRQLIRLVKELMVFEVEEVSLIEKGDEEYLLEVVESAYHYWRNMHRFALVYSKEKEGVLMSNFMQSDNQYNEMIINLYRTAQEKLQGYKNYIYRQLQAGTNGCLLLSKSPWKPSGTYEQLKDIRFIQKVMMRSPMIIHLEHNKRSGLFKEIFHNPIEEKLKVREYLCFPCFVGKSLTYIYFHKDFTASAIGLANLFEFAPLEVCNRKPDCIVLFGVTSQEEKTAFYYDEKEDLWVGSVLYMKEAEYFGYFKKMALTLANLSEMKKGHLPIHGAMINIYLKDGRKKGICLMGDSGAGKSETIEAVSKIFGDIERQEVIFDDMGSMYRSESGEVVAIGTEIGAFVRLDDLDASTAYKDLDRSIFFNPESSNSRIISPATNYQTIMQENKVDVFLYANNYSDEIGICIYEDVNKAKEVYKEGKRYALGTTSEKGLSTTYFANPFGPMQRVEECEHIIDEVFDGLKENHVLLGEIFTHLKDKDHDALDAAAKALLKYIEE